MKIDKSTIRAYPFSIRPLEETEGGGFFIEFPDLPGTAKRRKRHSAAVTMP